MASAYTQGYHASPKPYFATLRRSRGSARHSAEHVTRMEKLGLDSRKGAKIAKFF